MNLVGLAEPPLVFLEGLAARTKFETTSVDSPAKRMLEGLHFRVVPGGTTRRTLVQVTEMSVNEAGGNFLMTRIPEAAFECLEVRMMFVALAPVPTVDTELVRRSTR